MGKGAKRRAQRREMEVYAEAIRGLDRLEPDPEKRLKYLDFIDIYAALDNNELARYRTQYPQEADAMSHFADRFREEGMQKGMQQGMQQGMQRGIQKGMQQGLRRGLHEGEARVLARLLEARFGPLSDEVKGRLEQADEKTLLLWSERVLTARRIEDVMR